MSAPTISGLEATPPHLRLLEVAWRGLRKDRMEASLRRRATSTTGPSPREGEKVTCASWCDNQLTRSVGEKSDIGDQSRGRSLSAKPINERSDTAAHNIARAGQREISEDTTALHPQPSFPARAPDRATALGPKPANYHAAQKRPRSILPIRSGVLPPGRYAASREGYMVIVAPKERMSGLTEHSEIDGFSMTVVGKGLRVEVSTSGVCCMVSRTTFEGEEENLRLILEEQKSWKPEVVRIWEGVSAAIEKVQAATDRAVYNLEAGRLHISCNSPPEVIFYPNVFLKAPLDPSTAANRPSRQRLNSQASRQACMLSKLVLDIRSGSCTIVCASESHGNRYKSRRTLHIATFMDLAKAYHAEVQNIGKSDSTWSNEELRCLERFLVVRKHWEHYWSNGRTQGKEL